MPVNELLVTLTRVFFISLSVITILDFLSHRDPIRRDIALVFISLAIPTVILLFLTITGLQLPWLTKLGQLGVVGQPFLLLRLVAYFRAVPRNVKWGAIVGWGVSAV